jgi:hypothetical protein
MNIEDRFPVVVARRVGMSTVTAVTKLPISIWKRIIIRMIKGM